MGLFDDKKKRRKKIRPGDRIVYIVPEKRYRGTVLTRQGAVLMVALDDPKCVCQITRGEARRIKKHNA